MTPLHPDDPRLTAFLLGELTADEAASVEQALADDPSLRATLEALADTQRVLIESLAPGTHTLRPDQRDAVIRAARQQPRQPWLMPLAAAAAITLATAIFSQMPGHHPQSSAAHPPAPPPPAATANEARTPPVADQPVVSVTAATAPSADPAAPATSTTLELPVQAGRASLGKIRDSIRTEHRLPPHDSVRLEEILNNFQLTPNGLTAVARQPANHWHPDNRSTGATSHAATLATESLACPWKPSASLVLVTLRGNPFSACEVKAVFHPNQSNTLRCRLLGFAPTAGQPQPPRSDQLAAKAITSMVIEVEPSTTAGDLGVIEWSVNGETAAALAITRHGEAEPSDDARFAALVCTFAQWLAGESSGMLDADLLAALARESDSPSLPAERADFLQLIDQALKL
jgi:hypothetical protein